MFKRWKKSAAGNDEQADLTWDEQAKQALGQALAQAPVPKLLKNRLKNELEKGAEGVARAAGRTTVTAEDLMAGMLAKMPDHLRAKVEEAAKKGPAGLEQLQKELRHKK